MHHHHLTQLKDRRLTARGNKVLDDLFRKGTQSIRRFTASEADAKGCYRFLNNERITESDLTANLAANCRISAKDKLVVCIQDTTQIDLGAHTGRLSPQDRGRTLGPTNNEGNKSYGFLLHPSLVLDAADATPYGYAAVKLWNREDKDSDSSIDSSSDRDNGGNNSDKDGSKEPRTKAQPLSPEQKESYRWTEVSKGTKETLSDVAKGVIIVQDREGDIYEQFATIPDQKTALLIRSKSNRALADGTKLFDATAHLPAAGSYELEVTSKSKGKNQKEKRKARTARIEIRYREVVLCRPKRVLVSSGCPPSLPLYLVEAREVGYTGRDAICWRLLTTLGVEDAAMAQTCIEWYSWRWTIEEVFRILKKEGYNIEASELERGASVRKLSLLILEAVIRLFLMRLAYSEPEVELGAESCFSAQEQEFLDHQIGYLEGRTVKQKNPWPDKKDLKHYAWAIARMGGWKGYESKRHPGITTLWVGLQAFYAAMQGWTLHRNVSTR